MDIHPPDFCFPSSPGKGQSLDERMLDGQFQPLDCNLLDQESLSV